MRAAFRTWAAETGVEEVLAEAALAHVEGKVKRSYQHSDRLEPRRAVMQAYADFIDGVTPAPANKQPVEQSNVVNLFKVA